MDEHCGHDLCHSLYHICNIEVSNGSTFTCRLFPEIVNNYNVGEEDLIRVLKSHSCTAKYCPLAATLPLGSHVDIEISMPLIAALKITWYRKRWCSQWHHLHIRTPTLLSDVVKEQTGPEPHQQRQVVATPAKISPGMHITSHQLEFKVLRWCLLPSQGLLLQHHFLKKRPLS